MLYRGDDGWKAWKNNSSQTDLIRTHLLSKHEKIYNEVVILKKLKGWETINQSKGGSAHQTGEREGFSLKGFYERLLRWIAVDDQVRKCFIYLY